jgi:hypothetical protein
MGKMPHVDWKEWATKRPDWMRQDATTAFEAFIERKWLDALNIAAAEPASWKGDGKRAVGGARAPDKVAGSGRGVLRVTRAVNVVEQRDAPRSPSPLWELSFGRKCRARKLIGCNGDHVMLQCEKLMSLGLAERREVWRKVGSACSASSTQPSWSAMAEEAYPNLGALNQGAMGSTHPVCTS